MADLAHGPRTEQRDRIVFAIILIVIGIAGLLAQVWQPPADIGGWVVLVIGLGFVAAFAYTRQYGYLVPAGILTGLGAGIVVSQAVSWTSTEAAGGAVVLGLGVGFLAIWGLGSLVRLPQNHWWPIVPGGILAIVGGALLAGGQAVNMLDYWGIAAVGVGLLILWRALAGSRS